MKGTFKLSQAQWEFKADATLVLNLKNGLHMSKLFHPKLYIIINFATG